MSDDEHAELAAVVKGLAGMVVVSGYDCDLYRDLYDGWRRVSTEALADGARKRVEVMWLNKAAASALDRQTMPLFAD